jgi:hypothetical protein
LFAKLNDLNVDLGQSTKDAIQKKEQEKKDKEFADLVKKSTVRTPSKKAQKISRNRLASLPKTPVETSSDIIKYQLEEEKENKK